MKFFGKFILSITLTFFLLGSLFSPLFLTAAAGAPEDKAGLAPGHATLSALTPAASHIPFDGAAWMDRLNDELPLNSFDIPASRNAGAQYLLAPLAGSGQCQNTSIAQQLQDGTRALDLRVNNDKNAGMRIVTGVLDCYADSSCSSYLTLDGVLGSIYGFLQDNPSETVIVQITEEGSSTAASGDFSSTLLGSHVQQASPYWYTGAAVPTLADARGKIVLLRQYQSPTGEGIDPADWGTQNWMDFATPARCQAIAEGNHFLSKLVKGAQAETSLAHTLGIAVPANEGMADTLRVTFEGRGERQTLDIPFVPGSAQPTAALPKNLLYADTPYAVTACLVDGGGSRQSNILEYHFTTGRPKPALSFARCVKEGDTVTTADVTVDMPYKYSRIEYAVLDKNKSAIASSPASLFSVDRGTLVMGDSYYGQVTVWGPGDSFSVKLIGGPVPLDYDVLNLPVLSLSPGAVTYSSISVTWDMGAQASPVERFRLRCVGGGKTYEQAVAGAVSGYTFQGLQPGIAYDITVTAELDGVTATDSIAGLITNPLPNFYIDPTIGYAPDALLPVPLGAHFSSSPTVDESQITYTWYERAFGSTDAFALIPGAPDTSFIDYIAGSTSKEVQCVASWDDGTSSGEATSNIAIVCTPPATPVGVQATGSTSDSITLQWVLSADAQQYRVAYVSSDGADVGQLLVPIPGFGIAASVEITGLRPGTQYDFSIYGVGLGPEGARLESNTATFSASTLAPAREPLNPAIGRSPAGPGPFAGEITFEAQADSPDAGIFTYQWQLADGNGAFGDIAGETAAQLKLTPDAATIGKLVRCAITNTSYGTTAVAFTPAARVNAMAPPVTVLNAATAGPMGAVAAEVTWQNPALFGDYRVVFTPAPGSPATAQTVARILPGSGAAGDTMSCLVSALVPGVTYGVRVENLFPDPDGQGYLPADTGGSATTNVTMLAGAEKPAILETTGSLTVNDGDRVDLHATTTAPAAGATRYRWLRLPPAPNTLALSTLAEGGYTGTQTLHTSLIARLQNDGEAYLFEAVNVHNGDNRVAHGDPAGIHVVRPSDKPDPVTPDPDKPDPVKPDPDKPGPDKKPISGEVPAPGDTAPWPFFITLGALTAAALLVLIRMRNVARRGT